MESNTEYKKLHTQSRGETPRRPAPEPLSGRGGLRRSELEAWTFEELESAARVLGADHANGMDRAALIDALVGADATMARARRR
jgi:hypothetical protein